MTEEEILTEIPRRTGDDNYGKNRDFNFPDLPGIHFTLSHSETQVICSFSNEDVGVDIEKITEIDLTIAKHFFYRSMYAYLSEKTTKEEQIEAFFHLWTLKESLMKVTGKGMHLPMDSFEIQFGKQITVRHSMK